jgi:hypothetical protein
MSYEYTTSLPEFWTGAPTYNNPTGGLPVDLQNYGPSHLNWDRLVIPGLGDVPTCGYYGGRGIPLVTLRARIEPDWSVEGVDLLDNLSKLMISRTSVRSGSPIRPP